MLSSKQKTKFNSKHSYPVDILKKVPQGSIGPLLFSIFVCNLFIIIDTTYLVSYSNDNKPYVVRKAMPEFLIELEKISKKNSWGSLVDSEVVANAGKCYFILSIDEDHTIEINGFIVKNSMRKS